MTVTCCCRPFVAQARRFPAHPLIAALVAAPAQQSDFIVTKRFRSSKAPAVPALVMVAWFISYMALARSSEFQR